MNQSTATASPDPFWLDGGSTGVLLVHGYTGAPAEVRRIGDYLHARGYTVFGPLLPGHGLSAEAMNQTTWPMWSAAVDEAYARLAAACDTVFVAGLSMGSLLTLNFAADHPELPGIVLYSPAIEAADWRRHLVPVLKYVTPVREKGPSAHIDPAAEQYIWTYDHDPVRALHQLLKLQRHVRKRLPRVTVPALVIYSTGDDVITPDSAQIVMDGLGSADKELITLRGSWHVITVDAEWERVAEATVAFIQARDPGA